jgi:hypothetical protein
MDRFLCSDSDRLTIKEAKECLFANGISILTEVRRERRTIIAEFESREDFRIVRSLKGSANASDVINQLPRDTVTKEQLSSLTGFHALRVCDTVRGQINKSAIRAIESAAWEKEKNIVKSLLESGQFDEWCQRHLGQMIVGLHCGRDGAIGFRFQDHWILTNSDALPVPFSLPLMVDSNAVIATNSKGSSHTKTKVSTVYHRSLHSNAPEMLVLTLGGGTTTAPTPTPSSNTLNDSSDSSELNNALKQRSLPLMTAIPCFSNGKCVLNPVAQIRRRGTRLTITTERHIAKGFSGSPILCFKWIAESNSGYFESTPVGMIYGRLSEDPMTAVGMPIDSSNPNDAEHDPEIDENQISSTSNQNDCNVLPRSGTFSEGFTELRTSSNLLGFEDMLPGVERSVSQSVSQQ